MNLHCCRLGLLVFDLPPFSFGAPRCQPSSFLRWGCSLSMSLGFPLRLPVVDRPPFQLGLLAVDLPPFPAEPLSIFRRPNRGCGLSTWLTFPCGAPRCRPSSFWLGSSSLSRFLRFNWGCWLLTVLRSWLGLLVVTAPCYSVEAPRCGSSSVPTGLLVVDVLQFFCWASSLSTFLLFPLGGLVVKLPPL